MQLDEEQPQPQQPHGGGAAATPATDPWWTAIPSEVDGATALCLHLCTLHPEALRPVFRRLAPAADAAHLVTLDAATVAALVAAHADAAPGPTAALCVHWLSRHPPDITAAVLAADSAALVAPLVRLARTLSDVPLQRRLARAIGCVADALVRGYPKLADALSAFGIDWATWGVSPTAAPP